MNKLKLIEAILTSNCDTEITNNLPFTVGEKVFIRTATHYLTGKIKAITGKFLTLSDAAWVSDTGRFMQAIEVGTLSEVEPVTCDVRVNSDCFIDVYQWRFNLPRAQK